MLKLTQLAGFGSGGSGRFDLTIAQSTEEIDLHPWLSARGYSGQAAVAIVIAAGVQVSSMTTARPALRVGLADFPRHCRIALTIWGEICGRGGASAAAGGRALEVAAGNGATLAIDNRGEINGGGGGGARGAAGSCRNRAGSGKQVGCHGTTTVCAGGAGGTGYGPTAATAGASGLYRTCSGCGSCRGGTGSSGGGKGRAGNGGGGAAGAAVAGNTHIHWTARGVRNGTVS